MRVILILILLSKFLFSLEKNNPNIVKVTNNESLEIVSMLQGNIGSKSQLTTVPVNIKFMKSFPLGTTPLIFNLGLNSFSGKTKLSSYSEFVPINDISFEKDRAKILLDNAYFKIKAAKDLNIILGLVDTKEYGMDGLGKIEGLGDYRNGFISTHFLKPLALHSLEQRDYYAIPILGSSIILSENFNLKSYVTFGMPTEHIFFRNSWGLEANLKTSFGGSYLVHLGFADTEFSYTHHISPAILLGIEQLIVQNFGMFFKYSQAEKHKVSKFFTDIQRSWNFGIFYSSDNEIEKSVHYFGLGLSNVKPFEIDESETLLEIIYRFKLNEFIQLSPDLQFIYSPNGREGELILIWGLRLFSVII